MDTNRETPITRIDKIQPLVEFAVKLIPLMAAADTSRQNYGGEGQVVTSDLALRMYFEDFRDTLEAIFEWRDLFTAEIQQIGDEILTIKVPERAQLIGYSATVLKCCKVATDLYEFCEEVINCQEGATNTLYSSSPDYAKLVFSDDNNAPGILDEIEHSSK